MRCVPGVPVAPGSSPSSSGSIVATLRARPKRRWSQPLDRRSHPAAPVIGPFPVSGQGSLSLQILTPNLQQSFWRSCLLHSRSRQTASLRPSPLPRIWTPDSARGLPVARPLVVQSPTATGRTCSCAFLKLQ
ncbi:uncharacterized protein LOC123777851 isoform X2 [Ursus americanus]|uniref:uncharacterized protein LOC123777851 isoform X2 n=1 Tax=Ursus americanus TaxID=9643 RepID=UPI001E67D516|nr:uncharacterized protein LOC123777851 isoform X2 [Ursus americanus]